LAPNFRTARGQTDSLRAISCQELEDTFKEPGKQTCAGGFQKIQTSLFEIVLGALTMVKEAVATFSSFTQDLVDYVPPGLVIFIAAGFISGGAFLSDFRQEIVGTLLMIACTFSAGKWIGSESMRIAWVSHFLGVISADYFGGGPHVNPAVSVSMWALGKVTYTQMYVRIAGQMLGGLIAFPLYHALSNHFGWTPFGGPEFNMEGDHIATAEAFLSEAAATFLLCLLIYAVNWEMHFGKYHYWIKQSLTAIGIRLLIEGFPTAGPAMNPMLATACKLSAVNKS
jgi:aquaporin Z